MSSINITTRFNGAVLWSGEAASVRDAMEQACRSGADLRGAYLRGADLRDAYLSGAYLSGADLSGADLSAADLSSADLRDAYLSGAYLSGAYLSGAYLSGADLSGADLSAADLSSADLRDAYLSGAYLRGADLRDAYLSGAYLSGADLSGADLSSADLRDAYLSGAYLSGADLSSADLRDAKGADLAIAMTRILPEGRLIGWKKCANGVIVKLAIPEDAKRSHAFGRKCRAEFAEVLEIIGATEAKSHTISYDSLVYRVGETVRPLNGWSEDWQEKCAPGIHFFITRAEAEAYS